MTKTLELVDRHDIPSSVLDGLIGCDALRTDSSAVAVRHEALADYLRAKTLASMGDDQVLALLPSPSMPVGSFFPVLLMAQLRGRSLQSVFWERFSEADLGRYLDAFALRFDLSDELERSNSTTLSRRYLEDLRDWALKRSSISRDGGRS